MQRVGVAQHPVLQDKAVNAFLQRLLSQPPPAEAAVNGEYTGDPVSRGRAQGSVAGVMPHLVHVDQVEAGRPGIDKAGQFPGVARPEARRQVRIEAVHRHARRGYGVGAHPVAARRDDFATDALPGQLRAEFRHGKGRPGPGGRHAGGNVKDV